jgi:hypothetical protein
LPVVLRTRLLGGDFLSRRAHGHCTSPVMTISAGARA